MVDGGSLVVYGYVWVCTAAPVVCVQRCDIEIASVQFQRGEISDQHLLTNIVQINSTGVFGCDSEKLSFLQCNFAGSTVCSVCSEYQSCNSTFCAVKF